MRLTALGVKRALAVCVVLAACTTSAPGVTPRPPGPAPAGTIRLAYPSEPPTLNPVSELGASRATRDVLRPVWPALFALDSKLRPKGELASRWTVAEGGRRVRIRLREAKWSDGKAITAEDVRFTFGKLRAGPEGNRYRFLTEVRVPSPRVAELVFSRPYRRWWSLFSVQDGLLPAHAFSPEGWNRRPAIGGGPFVFAGWTPGLSIRLTPNPFWWGGRAKAAAIEVVFVPDDEDRIQLTASGGIDVMFSEGEASMDQRAKAALPRVSVVRGRSWWELDIRRRDDVTKAIALTLDRSLAAELLDGEAPMDSIPARFSDAKAPPVWPRSSLQEARALLRRAGFKMRGTMLADPSGDQVQLQLAAPESSGAAALGRFIHFRLRDIGLFTDVVSVQTSEYEREWLAARRADAYLVLRRAADAADADAYRADAAPFANPGGADAADAQIDASQTGAQSSLATGLAADSWTNAQQALAAQGAVLPLAFGVSVIGLRAGVEGPVALGLATGPLWNAQDWRLTARS